MNLVLLVGPQGAGKTTVAQEEFSLRTYINQDSQGKVGHWEAFEAALAENKPIAVDRINHTKEQRNRYLSAAKALGYETKIIVLHYPFNDCMTRCIERTDHPTIKDAATASRALHMFFSKYERVSDDEADVVERRYDSLHAQIWCKKTDCVVSDIDNTLANNKHREHFMQGSKKDWKGFFSCMDKDEVVPAVALTLDAMYARGEAPRAMTDVVLCSARPDDYRKVTRDWLETNDIHHNHLFMRQRNDYREDSLIKEQILDFEILTRDNIIFWLDDRKQVVDKIRSRGIPCFEVAPGEF